MPESPDAATVDGSLDEAETVRSSFVAAADRIADRYQILALIGSGGMGNVYRVRDLELEEIVALKFLRRERLASPGVLDRFRQEVKLARRVTHANVARTFDIGEHAGEKFLTMEFIDGPSLGAVLARDGVFDVARVIDIGVSLCAALAAAHAVGVVHRDLKPDNVMVAPGGRIVVTDFGIACAHGTSQTLGRIVGTPTYMAPEQVQGVDDLDGRADIYALGVVLFELLAGTVPWTGDNFVAVATRRLLEPPPDVRTCNPVVSATLAAVVNRCLATRRDDRYPTVEELAAALRSACDTGDDVRSLAAPRVVDREVASARGVRTIAVLPFRNAGTVDDEYIADELTDDLIDALSSVRGLRVRPRRAVTQRLALTADLSTIGRELDVQVVVEGSVRRRDGVVRISARVSSVTEGLQLWARRFERLAQEVLAINDEVAHAVAEALCADRNAPARVVPTNPEAVDLYLRARQALRHGWAGPVLGDLDAAVKLFERGLMLAPHDVGMLSGYAMARARRLNYSNDSENEPRLALELALRAVALAPNLGEPWVALATVHFTTSEWPAAARALRRAIDCSPGLQKAHEMLAAIELEVGCVTRGVARLETVLALDPESWVARGALAIAYSMLGREDAESVLFPAISLPRTTVPEEVGDYRIRLISLIRVQLYQRRFTATSGVLPELAPWVDLLSTALEQGVVEPEAFAVLERIIENSRAGARYRPICLQLVTEVFGILGDGPRAVATIARAVDSHLYDTLWLDHCPLLTCARLEPEFAPLRARVEARAAAVRAALEEP